MKQPGKVIKTLEFLPMLVNNVYKRLHTKMIFNSHANSISSERQLHQRQGHRATNVPRKQHPKKHKWPLREPLCRHSQRERGTCRAHKQGCKPWRRDIFQIDQLHTSKQKSKELAPPCEQQHRLQIPCLESLEHWSPHPCQSPSLPRRAKQAKEGLLPSPEFTS